MLAETQFKFASVVLIARIFVMSSYVPVKSLFLLFADYF
jgi:hypothetical protein